MFRKLVSNLPFNPSLITQIGFYSDRLRQENAIRRLSFVFIALAMIVQTIAIISPPERSLAYSTNHIINGIQSKQDIINAWNNDPSVSKIYGKFGVTLADINSLSNSPNATIRSDDGNDWWTIGRNSLSGYSNVKDIYKQTQITIEYDTNSYVYNRQLRAWDIRNPYNTYKAFRGTIASTGETFWILVDCGNFTKIGPYKEKDPVLDIRKTIDGVSSKPTLKPGDTFSFRFEYRNAGVDSIAKSSYIEDSFDVKHFDVISPKGVVDQTGYMRYELGNLPFTAGYQAPLIFTVKLKAELPNGLEVCNAARLRASNAADAWGGPACVNIINPCKTDPSLPSNSPNCITPVVVCSLVDSAIDRTNRKATFKTTVTSTNPALTKVQKYNYDFGDGKKEAVASSEFTNSVSHVYEPGEFKATVKVDFTAPTDDGTVTLQSANCAQPINFDKDEPLSQSKTVKNITKNFDNEQTLGSKVGAGDVLEYTLSTTNSQSYDRTGIKIEDYIGDILDYATLDTADLEANGGKFDKTSQKVSWDNVTIIANSSIKKTFKVTMLNPIPSTNQPSTVSTDFDCKISNSYGNEITLSVQCPAVKGIETIPNTGPGSSLIMGTFITAIVGYLFARSRLLNKELNLIRTDYANSGGA